MISSHVDLQVPAAATQFFDGDGFAVFMQGRQEMDVQGLQNRVPLACAGRVLFRQLRFILFMVGKTA